MNPIIHFKCRACETALEIAPPRTGHVRCAHCDRDIPIAVDPSMLDDGIVKACGACGHDTLYIQKDFNRQVGIGIVAAGIAASLYFVARNRPVWAMGVLGLTALVDFLVYSWVSEVTVCYSCHAIYRGFKRNPEHEPFDLKKLEKYGGRAPRLP